MRAEAALGVDARRGPGRPRNTDTHGRVLQATATLISSSEDLASVTITAITEASGVSRAAIYRRWSTREQVLAAALNVSRSQPFVPLTGDIVADLLESFQALAEMSDGRAIATLENAKKRVILGLQDPVLLRENWVSHVSRRRDGQRERLRVGILRGELPSDADVEAISDLISGVFYYQIVVRGEPLVGETLERVKRAVAHVLRP